MGREITPFTCDFEVELESKTGVLLWGSGRTEDASQ